MRTGPNDLCYCPTMANKDAAQSDSLYTEDYEALHDDSASYHKRKDFSWMYGS